jgi:hypothetical protein
MSTLVHQNGTSLQALCTHRGHAPDNLQPPVGTCDTPRPLYRAVLVARPARPRPQRSAVVAVSASSSGA